MAYNITPSTDHVKRGLARLLQQYKSKPRMVALLKSYLNRIQELEDGLWEIILYRIMGNAEGAQLDKLGKIVGRGRNNLSDSDYLIAIKGQIRINRSCGTPKDMIDVATLSLPSGFVFTYGEAYPAQIVMTMVSAVTFSITVLFGNLTATKPGGVSLFLIYGSAPPSNTFTFSPDLSSAAGTGQGFGDISDPSVGGLLPDLLIS